jgi:two-component system OmpR family response regulator
MFVATNDRTRVLVVDDNREAAITLAFVLEAVGYKVHTAFDAEAALAAAERFNPDACILDINMPGMNGYDLGRRLREQAPDRPPVLAAVTGYSDVAHLDRAADAGFDLHFTKPADPEDVVQQLEDCLCRQIEEAGAGVGQ